MDIDERIAALPHDKLLLFAQALAIYEVLPVEQAAQAVSFLFGERLKPLNNFLDFGVRVKDNIGRDKPDEVQDTGVSRSG